MYYVTLLIKLFAMQNRNYTVTCKSLEKNFYSLHPLVPEFTFKHTLYKRFSRLSASLKVLRK